VKTYQKHIDRNFGSNLSVWGVTPGLESTWKRINSGDILLFYFGDLEYQYAAEVIDTEQNLEFGLEVWPDYTDMSAGGGDTTDPWQFLIYLHRPAEIHLDSEFLHQRAGHSRMYPFKFAPFPDDQYDALLDEFESIRSFVGEHEIGPQSVFADSQIIQSTDREEGAPDVRQPKRTDAQISRIIRNSSMIRDLKERYDFRCQVCDEVRQRGSSKLYAEGHHLHPLGDDTPGPDTESNVLVLCPNHHADFDYGRIQIDPDSLEISHAYEEGTDGRMLTVCNDHEVYRDHIEYHNQNISDITQP
jgi:hypothetical protein